MCEGNPWFFVGIQSIWLQFIHSVIRAQSWNPRTHITIVNFISAEGLDMLMDFACFSDLGAQETFSKGIKKKKWRKSCLFSTWAKVRFWRFWKLSKNKKPFTFSPGRFRTGLRALRVPLRKITCNLHNAARYGFVKKKQKKKQKHRFSPLVFGGWTVLEQTNEPPSFPRGTVSNLTLHTDLPVARV